MTTAEMIKLEDLAAENVIVFEDREGITNLLISPEYVIFESTIGLEQYESGNGVSVVPQEDIIYDGWHAYEIHPREIHEGHPVASFRTNYGEVIGTMVIQSVRDLELVS